MSVNTTNLGLVKFAVSDKFRISQDTDSFNENMQILDDSVLYKEITWDDIEEEEDE